MSGHAFTDVVDTHSAYYQGGRVCGYVLLGVLVLLAIRSMTRSRRQVPHAS